MRFIPLMIETDFEKFRRNLYKARTIQEMTARDLASAAGLKQMKRILDIEEGRGKPSLDEVLAICHVLQQPIDNMLNNECEMSLDWKYKLAINQ
jgi:DNA-binding XRE family transcriptional regulator